MIQRSTFLLLAVLTLTVTATAQVSWWTPENPEPGDLVTIYYDAAEGFIPENSDIINLHWGINESGAGSWQEPPEEMWPEGTVAWGDNAAVQSPMIEGENSIWSIEIQTNDTTRSMHYVTTNGTDWDNNSDANWNIQLEQPEPTDSTWRTFVYDTRSQYATSNVEDISYIGVAGPFNNWNATADLLGDPDEHGVYSLDLHIPAVGTPYKFVVNGNGWTSDPDNPVTDGTQYGNSYIELETRDTPSFWHLKPVDGTIVAPGESVTIEGVVRPADVDGSLGETVIVTFLGQQHELTIDEATGAFGPEEVTIALGMTEGAYEAVFEVEDGEGETYTAATRIGIYEETDGYHAIDAIGDNTGPGEYATPTFGPNEPTADLLGMHIYEAAEGDSLRFEIELGSIDEALFTMVLLQISSAITGLPVVAPYAPIETATPEWTGSGIQILLSDPTPGDMLPQPRNRIIEASEPLVLGAEVEVDSMALMVDGVYSFAVAVADLEMILGSYNTGWYFAAMTLFEGNDGEAGVWDVTSEYGGSTNSPDVYDLMFTDNPATQRRVLGNFAADRTAALDNTGRGFTVIAPEEIGPNVGGDGPLLRWLGHGAPTVREEWTIWGTVFHDEAVDLTVLQQHDGGVIEYDLQTVTDTFSVDVTLQPGVNHIRAHVVTEGDTSWSPSMTWEYITPQAPEVEFSNYVEGGIVYLDASSSSDPQEQVISFLWSADPDNPETVNLEDPTDATTSFDIPDTPGEYYFDLVLTDNDDNETRARTFVTVTLDSVHPFGLNECAAWVDNAIVYQIFVRAYAQNDVLRTIADDMERIATLGFTTVWLTPIFPGPTNHGYEITDYYGIDAELGTMADFDYLVEQAHEHGLKVVLDLVINHSSILHPIMRDAFAYGEYSPYYDWYDRGPNGGHEYYYDWYSLPNFNFDNPDVWHYLIEMSKWWVTQHDIDGYRCDVAWGPQERNDQFWIAWREALKEIKPELFLLGEAGANGFAIFEDRFDMAYDWNLHHEGGSSFINLFPGPPNLTNLHNLITNFGYPWPPYKNPFRFLENHDEARYISENTPQQTKLAAQLLLSIPGVPMIYAGQEIGATSQRGLIPWGTDPEGVAHHYESLLAARSQFAALRTGSYELIPNNQNSFVYSVGRYLEGEPIAVSAMNFFSSSRVVTLTLPVEDWGLNPDSTYYLSNVATGFASQRTGSELATITTSLNSYSGALWIIADEPYDLGTEPQPLEMPLAWSLGQNYPNPFNPSCNIEFTMPRAAEVTLEVFNVLGQRVAQLANGRYEAGRHVVAWNGRADNGLPLASGVYFYRIEAGSYTATRKMMLMK